MYPKSTRYCAPRVALMICSPSRESGIRSKSVKPATPTVQVAAKPSSVNGTNGGAHAKWLAHSAKVLLRTKEIPVKSRRSQKISRSRRSLGDSRAASRSLLWNLSEKKTFSEVATATSTRSIDRSLSCVSSATWQYSACTATAAGQNGSNAVMTAPRYVGRGAPPR
eukprot:474727-Prymnesium_polylepis.1